MPHAVGSLKTASVVTLLPRASFQRPVQVLAGLTGPGPDLQPDKAESRDQRQIDYISDKCALLMSKPALGRWFGLSPPQLWQVLCCSGFFIDRPGE